MPKDVSSPDFAQEQLLYSIIKESDKLPRSWCASCSPEPEAQGIVSYSSIQPDDQHVAQPGDQPDEQPADQSEEQPVDQPAAFLVCRLAYSRRDATRSPGMPSPTVVVPPTSSTLLSHSWEDSVPLPRSCIARCEVVTSGKHLLLFQRDAFPSFLCPKARHSHVGTSLRIEHIIR